MTKEPLVLKFGYGKLRVQMCSVPAGHEPLHHSPVSVGVAIFTERDENTPACVLTFVDMHQASLVTEALAGRVSIPRSDLRQLLDMSGPTSFQPADVSLGALRNGLSVLIPQPVDLVEGAQDTIRALNTDIATFKEALEKSNIVADGLQTQWQDAVSAYDALSDEIEEMTRQLSNNEWAGGVYGHAGASHLASEISTLIDKYHKAKAGQQEWVCKDCNTIQPSPNCLTTDTRCPTVGCYGTLVPSTLNERRLETKVEELERHIKALPAEWRQASVPDRMCIDVLQGGKWWTCKKCHKHPVGLVPKRPNGTFNRICPVIGCGGLMECSPPVHEHLVNQKEIRAKENLEKGDMVLTDGRKLHCGQVLTTPEDVKALPPEGTLSATLPPAEHRASGVAWLHKCCNCGHTKWMREKVGMDIKCPVPDCPGILMRRREASSVRASLVGNHLPKRAWTKPYITSFNPSAPVHAANLPKKDEAQKWNGASLMEDSDSINSAVATVQLLGPYKVITTKIGDHEYSFNIDYVPQEQHAWLEEVLSSVFSRVVVDARNDTMRSLRKKLGVLKDLLK